MQAQILSFPSDPTFADALQVGIKFRNTSDKPVTLTLGGGSVRITIPPKKSVTVPMGQVGLAPPVMDGHGLAFSVSRPADQEAPLRTGFVAFSSHPIPQRVAFVGRQARSSVWRPPGGRERSASARCACRGGGAP